MVLPMRTAPLRAALPPARAVRATAATSVGATPAVRTPSRSGPGSTRRLAPQASAGSATRGTSTTTPSRPAYARVWANALTGKPRPTAKTRTTSAIVTPCWLTASRAGAGTVRPRTGAPSTSGRRNRSRAAPRRATRFTRPAGAGCRSSWRKSELLGAGGGCRAHPAPVLLQVPLSGWRLLSWREPPVVDLRGERCSPGRDGALLRVDSAVHERPYMTQSGRSNGRDGGYPARA